MRNIPYGSLIIVRNHLRWSILVAVLGGCGGGLEQTRASLSDDQNLRRLENTFDELVTLRRLRHENRKDDANELQLKLQMLRREAEQLRRAGYALRQGKRLRTLIDKVAVERLRAACKPNQWLVDLEQIQPHIALSRAIDKTDVQESETASISNRIANVESQLSGLKLGSQSGLYPSKYYLNRILKHLAGYRQTVKQILLKRHKTSQLYKPDQLKQLARYASVLEDLYAFLKLELSAKAQDVSWLGGGHDKAQCVNAIVQRLFTQDMQIDSLNERVHHHTHGLRRVLAETAREAQYDTLNEFMKGFKATLDGQTLIDSDARIQLSRGPFPGRRGDARLRASNREDATNKMRIGTSLTTQRIHRLRALNRLTADIGIHARGWSPAYAVKYLRSKSGITRERADAVVKRILSEPLFPNLSIVVILEIELLEVETRRILGDGFDAFAFGQLLNEPIESLASFHWALTDWLGRDVPVSWYTDSTITPTAPGATPPRAR